MNEGFRLEKLKDFGRDNNFIKETPEELFDSSRLNSPSGKWGGGCPTCIPSNPEKALNTMFNKIEPKDIPVCTAYLRALMIGKPMINKGKECEPILKVTLSSKGTLDSPLKNKTHLCSTAVDALRIPRKFTGDTYSSGNFLNSFQSLCISNSKQNDKSMAAKCIETYNDYVSSCLSASIKVVDHRIVDRIGLFLFANGDSKSTPACTGTIIDKNLVITARHCFMAHNYNEDGKLQSGNKYLKFVPNIHLLSGEDADKYDGELSGELTPDGIKTIELIHEQPSLGDDVIVVVLKNPVILENPELKVKIAEHIDAQTYLTIIGYQDLATRNDLLHGIINKEEKPYYYFKNIMMDNSLLCFKGADEVGGFQHYCQTMSGMSGAPLFIGNLEDVSSVGFITIAGVLSGGNDTSDVDVEEQGAPNKAAMVNEQLLDALYMNSRIMP
ncbi:MULTISPECIES: trypsin-like serine protease [Enterobacterales]|uniref:trypsin-like serine peptidase n=1 Tax=Enterobacterales TaxID=91347 RepID=UPI0012F659AE|nr:MULTISPECIES: trypsin-like serine protease [Enterobacterales]KAJ9430484.1 trypsin-like serine protease [Pantoea sp. YR343]MBB3307142.1 V8-like Glu-specific endopeptidase [Enterobacter sp. Sphag1F]NYI15534.1 V8-like Glu-specific endopeptidase [Enterobacter sp. Sphag71]